MNDEEFLSKLSEVAEWRQPRGQQDAEIIPRPKRTTKVAKARTLTADEIEYNDDDEYRELPVEEQNFPPMLLKVKKACACEDCGQHCEDGRTVDIRHHQHAGKKCWRKRCTACEQWQDPYTNEFNQTGMENMQQWNKYLRGEAKGERRALQQHMEQIISNKIEGRNVDIIDNDFETIVKYRD